MKTLILGKGIQEIDAWAFAECHELTDVYCYRKTVPNANTRCFENSGIEYATLHVPNSAIDNYGAKVPWKNFKEIVKIDMPKHRLTYMVDNIEYKSCEIEEDEAITLEPAPTKEGYTFSGWSEIPEMMPDHDVTVTGTFTQETGIDQIMSDENGKAMIFTIDGKRVDNTKKGLNVIRMKDGTTRKVVVK